MIKKISAYLLKNGSPKETILKNTFWLLLGQVFGRIIRTALIVYAARILGAGSWGSFSYALSLAAFLSIFSDLGINAFTTRELSRKETKNSSLLSAGFFVKFIFTFLLILFAFIFSSYLSPLEEARGLIFIAVLIFAFDSVRDFGSSLTRAAEKMEIESLINILTNLMIAILGFIFLYFFKNSFSLAWGYALGSLSGSILMIFAVRKTFLSFLGKINFSDIKKVLSLSLPFSVMSVMGAVMINTDIVIISWMLGAESTGLFAAAEKPIQLLYLLPSVFAASLFPMMSRISENKNGEFKKVFEKSVSTILALALPISLGGFILSKEIIFLLYGPAYLASSLSFAILSLTIFIIFPSIIIGNAVFALNEQKKLIAFSLFGMLGNIILDIVLIPKFGITGCAFATLLNQFIINAYLLFRVKKMISFSLFPYLKKIILASLIMSALTLSLSYFEFHLISNILLSSIFYLALLILFKEKLLLSFLKK
ncbi:MAG: flippase [Candidatus Pacebacteria bacterium]|nr:flippase [Candidatus Paceibacterota bacterium]